MLSIVAFLMRMNSSFTSDKSDDWRDYLSLPVILTAGFVAYCLACPPGA